MHFSFSDQNFAVASIAAGALIGLANQYIVLPILLYKLVQVFTVFAVIYLFLSTLPLENNLEQTLHAAK